MSDEHNWIEVALHTWRCAKCRLLKFSDLEPSQNLKINSLSCSELIAKYIMDA